MNEKPSRGGRRLPVWAMILLDLAGLAVCLLVFALFHHVLPRSLTPARQPEIAVTPPPVTAAPVAETAAETASDVPAPEATPDPRSPWAIAFADRFSDEIVITESSYSSPNLSVTVERREIDYGWKHDVCFIADVYISELSCLRTYLAQNTFGRGIVEDIETLHADSGAVLSMTGDFYSYQGGSLVLRNGVLLRDGKWQPEQTHLVLFNDGRMEVYEPFELDLDAVLAEGAWQIWSFGPILLRDGVIPDRFPGGMAVDDPNPRAAIGYYEPGHYCFVVVDGRRPAYSYGCTFAELADIFADLGCTLAYNLDGGGSAVMMLHDGLVNDPSGGGRSLSDIILFAEPLGAAEEPTEAEEGGGAA